MADASDADVVARERRLSDSPWGIGVENFSSSSSASSREPPSSLSQSPDAPPSVRRRVSNATSAVPSPPSIQRLRDAAPTAKQTRHERFEAAIRGELDASDAETESDSDNDDGDKRRTRARRTRGSVKFKSTSASKPPGDGSSSSSSLGLTVVPVRKRRAPTVRTTNAHTPPLASSKPPSKKPRLKPLLLPGKKSPSPANSISRKGVKFWTKTKGKEKSPESVRRVVDEFWTLSVTSDGNEMKGSYSSWTQVFKGYLTYCEEVNSLALRWNTWTSIRLSNYRHISLKGQTRGRKFKVATTTSPVVSKTVRAHLRGLDPEQTGLISFFKWYTIYDDYLNFSQAQKVPIVPMAEWRKIVNKKAASSLTKGDIHPPSWMLRRRGADW